MPSAARYGLNDSRYHQHCFGDHFRLSKKHLTRGGDDEMPGRAAYRTDEIGMMMHHAHSAVLLATINKFGIINTAPKRRHQALSAHILIKTHRLEWQFKFCFGPFTFSIVAACGHTILAIIRGIIKKLAWQKYRLLIRFTSTYKSTLFPPT